MNRVFDILDDIITTVESAKGVPMSSSAMVNRPALLDLLDDLRDAFPAAVEDAREILAERDEIVDSAKQEAGRVHEASTGEAQRLVAEAHDDANLAVAAASKEAERLVRAAEAESTEVVQRAQAEADRVRSAAATEHARLVSESEVHRSAVASAAAQVTDAEARADELRGEADDYIDARLGALEDSLHKMLGTVKRGRDNVQVRATATAGVGEPRVYDQSA